MTSSPLKVYYVKAECKKPTNTEQDTPRQEL